jgi:hypothetical protein
MVRRTMNDLSWTTPVAQRQAEAMMNIDIFSRLQMLRRATRTGDCCISIVL